MSCAVITGTEFFLSLTITVNCLATFAPWLSTAVTVIL